MNTESYIDDQLKRLSRSLMRRSFPDTFKAHRNLYEVGRPVIPYLEKKLNEIDWSFSKYKEISAYVSGLYSLLHDLDEEVAQKNCEIIIQNGCPKHIKAILQSVNQFSVKNYKRYNIKRIEIFEHKLVQSKCDIKFYLNAWLDTVPFKDLADISRLYVITKEKINSEGTYTPQINSIALLWENSYKEKSLLFWFFSLLTEKVLYHEIGHHKHRHTFGTDPDQEKEADRYAAKIMKNNHPILSVFLNMISKMGLKSCRNYYRWGL